MKLQYIHSTVCLVAIGLLMMWEDVKAQTASNYILKERTISQSSPQIRSYQFFDGLGRATAEATNGISSDRKFTYSLQEHLGDNLIIKKWLPVVGDTEISHYRVDDIASMASAQYANSSAYGNYEYNALGRVKKQFQAGGEWKNKPVTISYITNGSEDVRKFEFKNSPWVQEMWFGPDDIKHYYSPGSISDEGYYDSETLFGTCETNEDGTKLTTYTDVNGKKVLERRGEHNDTYFIYDGAGMLCCVLMPGYQADDYNLDLDADAKQAFWFDYDKFGNLILMQYPNCWPIEYSYDKCNHLAFVQDGELRDNNLYRFRLYDKLGRMVIQGLSSTRPETYWEFLVYYDCGSQRIANTDYTLPEGVYLGRDDRWESKAPKINSEDGNETSNNGYVIIDKDNLDVIEEDDYRRDAPVMPPPPEPILYQSYNITLVSIEIVNYYDDYQFLEGANKDAFKDLSQPSSTNSKGMLTGSVVFTSDGRKIASVYSHDIQGNLIEVREKGLDESIVKIENTYTYTNKIACSKAKIRYPKGEDIEYTIRNSYNPNNDFLNEATYQAKIGNKSTGDCKISYTYDQLGRIASIDRPVGKGKGNVSYSYDIHGWLTNINNNSFSEQLHYNDGAGAPLYSGNISSMTLKSGSSSDRGYKYSYDELGRLVNSEYGENNFSRSLGNYDERVSYDANGNITSLFRNSVLTDGTCRTVDNLTIDYEGNQLYSVEEKASPVLNSSFLDVKKSSSDFKYNSSGSLVYDGTRGITNIRYDNNNNPIRIQFDNGSVTRYVYSVTGQKLRTIHYTAPKNIHVEMGCDYEDIESNYLTKDSVDYFLGGNVIYENNQFSKILFDGGYIDSYTEMESLPVRPIREFAATDGDYQIQLEEFVRAQKTKAIGFKFYNKDHLGNNREVIDQDGNICQKTDYYPFGTPYFSRYVTINGADQPFKYNGKEFDMMHGLNTYDYGARQYNPILPMWDRVDPLAEKYCNVSPYAYCANNPVKYVDPDGKKVKILLTGQDRMNVLDQMQKLTNDKLEVLCNGEVRIVEHGNMNTSYNLSTGTKLISSLIEDEHCTSIDRYSGFKNRAVFPADASNGTGSDTKVLVNFNKKLFLLVKDKKSGRSVIEESPSYINLGHELIHAYRTVNGVKKKDDDYSEYMFTETNGQKFRTSQRTEELETVGIKGGLPFTENMLREEHGINKRIKY